MATKTTALTIYERIEGRSEMGKIDGRSMVRYHVIRRGVELHVTDWHPYFTEAGKAAEKWLRGRGFTLPKWGPGFPWGHASHPLAVVRHRHEDLVRGAFPPVADLTRP